MRLVIAELYAQPFRRSARRGLRPPARSQPDASGRRTSDLSRLPGNAYSYSDADHEDPTWSPDGGRIAFYREQRAAPVALLLGLGLAALGGSMAPLEVFPSTARKIAHLTPHAWGNDAFSELLNHGAHLTAVLPQIGVLLAFATVALTLAIWRLQRSLTA